MGNKQSSKQAAEVEIELNHPRVRFVRVVNDPKHKHMHTVFTANKDDYLSWATLLLTRKLTSNHLLLPLSYQYQASQFCGTSGQVKVNYQSYPYLLTEQIESRRHKKKKFNETELWLLLFCLLEGQRDMRTYSKGELGIGDVRPENVFINHEGLMKVACWWSWPKETGNYQKFLENQITYLAPQDLPFIEQQKVSNSQNPKSQLFSIGLTILSAANLTSYNNLYNITTKRFAIEQFVHALNQWRLNQFYSDIFKSTLASLLEIDPAKRIDEKTMFEWIEGYRADILASKDFVINDPPQVIIDQVEIIKALYETVGGSRFNKNVGEGEKKVVVGGSEGKQFVPTSLSPIAQQQPLTTNNNSIPNIAAESTYLSASNQKPLLQQYSSNPLTQQQQPQLQPLSSTLTTPIQFQFMNRTSVPTLYSQNKILTESIYTKNYGTNQPYATSGLLAMGKMNFSAGDITEGYSVPKLGDMVNKVKVQGQEGKMTTFQEQSPPKPSQIASSQSPPKQQQYSSPSKQ